MKHNPCHADFLLFQNYSVDLCPFLSWLLFVSLALITSFPYSILVFSMPRQKSRTPTKLVAQLWASKHSPRIQLETTLHTCSNGTAVHRCWISPAGTWGKKLLQGCAEEWDLAVVSVSCKVRNVTGLRVRLSAFTSYCSFFISDVQGDIHVFKRMFLQIGWSSGSPYIARKETGTSRVPVPTWLKHLLCSMAYKCSLYS